MKINIDKLCNKQIIYFYFIFLSYLFNNLHYILISQYMILAYFLRIELDRAAPNHRIPKILNHISVNLITKSLNRRMLSSQNNRHIIIRIFTFRFSINSNQIQILPHSINHLIEIPFKITSNRHIMWDLV